MRHSGLLPRRWAGPVVMLAALTWAVSCGTAGAVPLRVTCDRAPDTTSLDSLIASITRDCRTDDERAIAIYSYLRYALYHHAYPREPGGIGALKLIHVYGWSLCGGEHTVLAAMYERAGWQWRYRGWSSPGHTTVEASYGGSWHWLDVFLKFICWRPDPTAAGGFTIASQEDIVHSVAGERPECNAVEGQGPGAQTAHLAVADELLYSVVEWRSNNGRQSAK